ncbi:hypothetical protein M1437_02570, partial [Patescibacteria group bacterium]|nr:hypothetical protein [Patescibacteria group bacterium]
PFASEGIRTVYRCQGGRDGYEFKILQGSKSPKLMSLDEIEKDLWQSKSHNESITVERVILKKGSGIFNQFKYLNGSGQIIDNEKATEGRLILDTTEKRFVLTISGYCLYDNSKAKEELIQTANSLSSFK